MTKEYICPLYFKDDYGTFILQLIVELRHLRFDNSDNQVLAVFGLWDGWNALVKSKDNQRDKIEHILPWKFLNK